MVHGMSGVEFIGLAFELAEADNLKQPEATWNNPKQPCYKAEKMSGPDWLSDSKLS